MPRLAVFVFVFLMGLFIPPAVAATPVTRPEDQQTEVLFLSFSDPDLRDVSGLIEEAETQILEGRDAPVHFTLEYVDPSIFEADLARQKKTLAFLKEKHQEQAFDLVITIGGQPDSLEKLSRARLFPTATLFFFTVNREETSGGFKASSNATGVVRRLNYLPTLQLALQQNPGTRRVIVVSGSSELEKLEVQVAREQFQSYESSVEFQYWTDLKFAYLRSRLAGLSPDNIVLFLDFLEDAAGEQFTPERVLRTVARTSSRPIYGTYLSFVGNGVVGGHVADLSEVGRILGRQGARVLNGESPQNIPVETGEFQRDVFDWRQLHRWRISEDDLPRESSVLFWQSSPWELYRSRILTLLGLIAVETLLIVLLLKNRASRKKAEEQLKKSEERFSKAFRQGPMAVTLTNAETHRYIDANETFERFSGYGREELIGRSALEVGIWAVPGESQRFLKQLLADGHLRNVEFQFRTKDGQLRVAETSAELIEIGGEQCVLGAAVDITDRKRAEQNVLESEKRFRLMADSAPVLMWLSGADKLCTDFNQEWLRFTGRTMQQELGEGWTLGVHPDDLQTCLGTYSHAFDARRRFSMEYRLRRHDGEYRWMLDQGVPRFLENGGFAGYIGCCFDITEQKEAKAVLTELGGRLIHAQEEERARIARELHDDINQRLALLANGLQELALNSEAPRKAEQNELGQLWQLTSEIATDIQHLSHRLHPSKLHYLGLAAAVRDLCQEFSRQHKIEVECIVRDLPGDIDEIVALSLFRTIQESLHNIAKHSHAHHVNVELSRQQNLVRLRVSDDGVGFNSERPAETHGLGLVSMRERLKSVGGHLSIWSRPSGGTQVEGTVPASNRSAQIA